MGKELTLHSAKPGSIPEAYTMNDSWAQMKPWTMCITPKQTNNRTGTVSLQFFLMKVSSLEPGVSATGCPPGPDRPHNHSCPTLLVCNVASWTLIFPWQALSLLDRQQWGANLENTQILTNFQVTKISVADVQHATDPRSQIHRGRRTHTCDCLLFAKGSK